ncbi:alkaline phosphatase family protein [Aggregicoccus sp. 17bor-14]|uniref:alkaline phosphatase D family protein n=1 Tax=Myxococcaceae TaxID=31 RepID=UPI00129D1342|nr:MULTISPECIES: alkaline phosphatase D family protein [Myxococcaceae]MBF5045207.1 alkaline phosphatase family protein [Simulacricoccus sp. 17bor-14]MRI90948.1 alkaline phosphatase family protein [Aggregicoccus sp. 17bor-14]
MPQPLAFAISPLERAVAVGAVTSTSARLWFRAPSSGPYTLLLRREGGRAQRLALPCAPRPGADGTCAFTLPGDVPGAPALRPDTPYSFELGSAGERLGEGRFHTAPDAHPPERLAFGLVSCHQPFDPHGRVREDARAVLRAAQEAYARAGVRFVLWTGDQLYADQPERLSLYAPAYFAPRAPAGRARLQACTAAEVRRLYQARYREFWALPELQALQAQFPGYPMLDDHDVVNNWGSDPAHAGPGWRSVRQGALAAYRDYQGSRVGSARASGSLHYAFDWGPVGLFVLDLRTGRRVEREGEEGGGRVLAPRQLSALARWLAARASAPALFVVAGVPPVFLPRWAATLIGRVARTKPNEGADRWSHRHFVRERDALLRLLHAHQRAHPRQRLVLLSGDVHVGSALALRWPDAPPSYQLTSSALTNAPRELLGPLVARSAPHVHRLLRVDGGARPVRVRVDPLPGAAARGRNPYGGLNFGLVEVDLREPAQARVSLRLLAAGRGGAPRAVFESGPL